jgi:hypothetical protein
MEGTLVVGFVGVLVLFLLDMAQEDSRSAQRPGGSRRDGSAAVARSPRSAGGQHVARRWCATPPRDNTPATPAAQSLRGKMCRQRRATRLAREL